MNNEFLIHDNKMIYKYSTIIKKEWPSGANDLI